MLVNTIEKRKNILYSEIFIDKIEKLKEKTWSEMEEKKKSGGE